MLLRKAVLSATLTIDWEDLFNKIGASIKLFCFVITLSFTAACQTVKCLYNLREEDMTLYNLPLRSSEHKNKMSATSNLVKVGKYTSH